MSWLAGDAQQIHCVLSSLLLIHPVLCRPDTMYIHWTADAAGQQIHGALPCELSCIPYTPTLT